MSARLVAAVSALAAATATLVIAAVSVSTAVPPDATADAADSLAPQAHAREEPLADGVTVYYFHHTIRCVTCIAAEALADTLVHTTFASEVDAGELMWAVVNLDGPGNEQFADTYGLGPFGLIVSVRAGGDEFYWRELKSIEDLTGYPDLYNEYVRSEIQYALDVLENGVMGVGGTKEEDHDENAGGALP